MTASKDGWEAYRSLAAQHGFGFTLLEQVDPVVAALIPLGIQRDNGILAFGSSDGGGKGTLFLAVDHPQREEFAEELRFQMSRPVKVFLTPRAALVTAWDRFARGGYARPQTPVATPAATPAPPRVVPVIAQPAHEAEEEILLEPEILEPEFVDEDEQHHTGATASAKHASRAAPPYPGASGAHPAIVPSRGAASWAGAATAVSTIPALAIESEPQLMELPSEWALEDEVAPTQHLAAAVGVSVPERVSAVAVDAPVAAVSNEALELPEEWSLPEADPVAANPMAAEMSSEWDAIAEPEMPQEWGDEAVDPAPSAPTQDAANEPTMFDDAKGDSSKASGSTSAAFALTDPWDAAIPAMDALPAAVPTSDESEAPGTSDPVAEPGVTEEGDSSALAHAALMSADAWDVPGHSRHEIATNALSDDAAPPRDEASLAEPWQLDAPEVVSAANESILDVGSGKPLEIDPLADANGHSSELIIEGGGIDLDDATASAGFAVAQMDPGGSSAPFDSEIPSLDEAIDSESSEWEAIAQTAGDAGALTSMPAELADSEVHAAAGPSLDEGGVADETRGFDASGTSLPAVEVGAASNAEVAPTGFEALPSAVLSENDLEVSTTSASAAGSEFPTSTNARASVDEIGVPWTDASGPDAFASAGSSDNEAGAVICAAPDGLEPRAAARAESPVDVVGAATNAPNDDVGAEPFADDVGDAEHATAEATEFGAAADAAGQSVNDIDVEPNSTSDAMGFAAAVPPEVSSNGGAEATGDATDLPASADVELSGAETSAAPSAVDAMEFGAPASVEHAEVELGGPASAAPDVMDAGSSASGEALASVDSVAFGAPADDASQSFEFDAPAGPGPDGEDVGAATSVVFDAIELDAAATPEQVAEEVGAAASEAVEAMELDASAGAEPAGVDLGAATNAAIDGLAFDAPTRADPIEGGVAAMRTDAMAVETATGSQDLEARIGGATRSAAFLFGLNEPSNSAPLSGDVVADVAQALGAELYRSPGNASHQSDASRASPGNTSYAPAALDVPPAGAPGVDWGAAIAEVIAPGDALDASFGSDPSSLSTVAEVAALSEEPHSVEARLEVATISALTDDRTPFEASSPADAPQDSEHEGSAGALAGGGGDAEVEAFYEASLGDEFSQSLSDVPSEADVPSLADPSAVAAPEASQDPSAATEWYEDWSALEPDGFTVEGQPVPPVRTTGGFTTTLIDGLTSSGVPANRAAPDAEAEVVEAPPVEAALNQLDDAWGQVVARDAREQDLAAVHAPEAPVSDGTAPDVPPLNTESPEEDFGSVAEALSEVDAAAGEGDSSSTPLARLEEPVTGLSASAVETAPDAAPDQGERVMESEDGGTIDTDWAKELLPDGPPPPPEELAGVSFGRVGRTDVLPGTPKGLDFSDEDLLILESIERIADGDEDVPGERVRPARMVASLVRLLLKKGVINEVEFLAELSRK